MTPGMFEVLGIDLVGDAGVGLGYVATDLTAPGNWNERQWAARWRFRGRVVPEAAVFEDLADDVALAGLDEGDDLHGAVALRAAKWIGVASDLAG